MTITVTIGWAIGFTIISTIEKATGVKLYRFSHMTHGQYEADKVEIEMQQNLVTLVEAMQFAASKDQA